MSLAIKGAQLQSVLEALCQLSYFTVQWYTGGSNAVIQLQGIAHVLVIVAIVYQQVVFIIVVRTAEHFLTVVVFRQHVQHDDILQAVIVIVGNIYPYTVS